MSLASQDLCTIPEKNFSTALKKSKSSFTCCSFAGSTYNVAARCGNAERVFRLPPSERIDFKKLNNRAPEIARLWDLFNTVYAKAFGEQPGSGEQSPLPRERYAEFQNTGAALLLELISGKFDLGVGKPLSQTLAEFHGSVGWPSVILVNKDEIPLAKYVAPYYPSMARLARIEGDVELAITPDSENGKVDRVTLVSGQPLLAVGAIDAAKSWIFKWGQTSPVRAKFKFSLGCHS